MKNGAASPIGPEFGSGRSLGLRVMKAKALGGRLQRYYSYSERFRAPFQGLMVGWLPYPGRCPGLESARPFGAKRIRWREKA